MLAHLRMLNQYRDLLYIWTLREIRIRYKQSAIGGLWAILQPLSLMIVFTAVFSILAKVPTGGIPYPIFSYTALLPWTLFSASISFAVPSLVNNMNLITKIFFPREVIPIANVGAACFDFIIASLIFLGMMLYYRISVSWNIMWIPLILAIQITLTLGIVFIASAVNVFYRDIRFVIPLVMQVWMYASPIIYPVSLVPEKIRPFYMLNPLAGLIESYRRVLLEGQMPNLFYLAISGVIGAILFISGYAYFKRAETTFADLI